MAVANAAKAGFGLALGFGALQIIGIILFLIGLFLAMPQKKKEGKDRNMAAFGVGIAFMVLGVAMGFGGGADQLLNMFSGGE